MTHSNGKVRCKRVTPGRIIIVLFALMVFSGQAQSQSKFFVPLFEGSQFFCGEDRFGPLLAKQTGDSLLQRDFREVGSRRVFLRSNKRLRKLVRRLRRARRRAIAAKVEELTSLVANARMEKSALRQCRRGTLPALEDLQPLNPTAACDALKPPSAFSAIVRGAVCDESTSTMVRIVTDPNSFCSGTIIGERLVLTAAHCFLDNRNRPITDEVLVEREGDFLSVEKFEIHPSFSGFDAEGNFVADFDVALVTVNAPFNVRPKPLYLESEITPGEIAAIGGFGEDAQGNTQGLRAGFMRIEGAGNRLSLQAIFDGTTSDTCAGDSGGPLLVFREGQWRVAAVTSFGTNTFCEALDVAHFASLSAPEIMEFVLARLP